MQNSKSNDLIGCRIPRNYWFYGLFRLLCLIEMRLVLSDSSLAFRAVGNSRSGEKIIFLRTRAFTLKMGHFFSKFAKVCWEWNARKRMTFLEAHLWKTLILRGFSAIIEKWISLSCLHQFSSFFEVFLRTGVKINTRSGIEVVITVLTR